MKARAKVIARVAATLTAEALRALGPHADDPVLRESVTRLVRGHVMAMPAKDLAMLAWAPLGLLEQATREHMVAAVREEVEGV